MSCRRNDTIRRNKNRRSIIIVYTRWTVYRYIKTKDFIALDVKNKTHKLQTILICIGFDSIIDFSKRVPLENVLQRIRDNINTLIQYTPLHKIQYDSKNKHI